MCCKYSLFCAHYVTKEKHLTFIFITKFCFFCVLCLQEQASIGCHTPICTISQTKLEVCGMLVMFIVIFSLTCQFEL